MPEVDVADRTFKKLRKSIADSKSLLEKHRLKGQSVIDAIDALTRLDKLVVDPSEEELQEIGVQFEKIRGGTDDIIKYVPLFADTVNQLGQWFEQTMMKRSLVVGRHTIEIEPIKTEGYILDIGGGGEGIIGRLNGRDAISIDLSFLTRQDNDSLKILMDATDLKFLSSQFDVAASFFTFMYIENNDHLKVFKEVHRVLKDRGRFLIWDSRIPERFEDKRFFVLPLEILLPDERVESVYGAKLDQQSLAYFKGLAARSGFEVVEEWVKNEIFFLEL
ncbi:MAG: class I SAM-dependent methyltransferase, partial [Candidatus Helarchaeota archaeon]|nr:class I SAM-dependent methyltransferase [Candidatus Helarchaeota archaeon]